MSETELSARILESHGMLEEAMCLRTIMQSCQCQDCKAARADQPRPAETDKEKLASWMCDQGYATGHGDSMDDLLVELKGQIQPRPAVPDDTLYEIICNAHMAGQSDAGVDPGYSNARAYANEIIAAQQPEGGEDQ